MRFKTTLLLSLFIFGMTIATAQGKRVSTVAMEAGEVGAAGESIEPTEISGQLQHNLNFDLSSIRRTVPKNIRSDGLFNSKSWYAPQPPVVIKPVTPEPSLPQQVSESPAKPAAPALPFAYIGRMIDGDEVALFLFNNGRQFTARTNDVLEGKYRIDSIKDSEAEFTYLPLEEKQVLVYGAGTPAPGIPIALAASAAQLPPIAGAVASAPQPVPMMQLPNPIPYK